MVDCNINKGKCMMNEQNGLELAGIKCENQTCDYRNEHVLLDEYINYLNIPCPKCGEILLTENDFNLVKMFGAMVSIANKLESDDEVVEISTSTSAKVYQPSVKE